MLVKVNKLINYIVFFYLKFIHKYREIVQLNGGPNRLECSKREAIGNRRHLIAIHKVVTMMRMKKRKESLKYAKII
jgi:hypothetical protein